MDEKRLNICPAREPKVTALGSAIFTSKQKFFQDFVEVK